MTAEITKDRIISSLHWMTDTFKWQHEQTGIGGGYSPELTDAIELLEQLNDDNILFLIGEKSELINQCFTPAPHADEKTTCLSSMPVTAARSGAGIL